jgi:hypothetical protein
MKLRKSRLRVKIAALVFLWASAGALFALTGCSRAGLAYRLDRHGPDEVLIPPRAVWPANAPTFDVTIANARDETTASSNCNIESAPISVKWQGRDAKVELRPQQVEASGRGSVTSGGIYVDPVRGVETFRHSLTEIEERGCLRPDEDYAFKKTLTQKLPLPPSLAYQLLFGNFALTGSFDLTSDFRLVVTSPIYSKATGQSLADLAGHEAAYYSLVRSESEDRVRIVLASVIETPLNGKAIRKTSAQLILPLSASPGYWRLLLRAERAGENSITRAILLSAASKSDLDQAQQQIQGRQTDFCAPVTGTEAGCYAFPANSGVNAELRVVANGKPVFIHAAYATLGEIIHEPIPPSVKIKRFFQGRLIPVKLSAGENLSGMQLMPGDRITW